MPPAEGVAEADDGAGHIRAQCLAEVRSIASEALARMKAGHPGEYTIEELSSAVSDLAVEAAVQGEIEEVEWCIDVLVDKTGVPGYAIARACSAGVMAGSQRAFDILNDALSLEQQKVWARIESDDPERVRPHAGADLLDEVVRACGENQVPPEIWVNKVFAQNSPYAWKVLRDHYAQQQDSIIDASEYRERFESIAAELTEEGKFSPAFVLEEVPVTLPTIQDPSLRRQLMDHFLGAASRVSLTEQVFARFCMAGETVLSDPALHDMTGIFGRTITDAAVKLQEAGVDVHKLDTYQLRWNIGLARYRHELSPTALVDKVTEEAERLIDSEAEHMRRHILGQPAPDESGVRRVDHLLSEFAQEYAQRGDFAAVQIIAERIGNDRVREATLGCCVESAVSAEQIAYIEAIPATPQSDNQLFMHLEFARARVSDDLNNVETLGRNIASGPTVIAETEAERIVRHANIIKAYELVFAHNEQRGIAFGREMLAVMKDRNHAEDKYLISSLSHKLAGVGDTEEARRIYAEIQNHSSSPREKLQALRRLARSLPIFPP